MLIKHIIIGVALLFALPLSAQRARKKAPIKKKPVVEEPQEDPRITAMREATQRIVFIDSIVVDKQGFLSQYKLSAESGQLMYYADFFHNDEQPYSICFLNELGNKAWFAKSGTLYTTDLLGGKEWNTPAPLEGLDRELFSPANYPFMMADGTTFYFSAAGPESIGGLDIFVTRYDSNTGKFLLPENIGMPFNSEANDYMIAFDEMSNIGYFATDRRQPEGKVCIYTFIPNKKRITYSPDEYDENVIKSRARIESIADTWNDEARRNDALNRLNSIEKSMAKSKQEDFWFVVNDDIVYTSFSDFRSNENRERMKQLESLRKKYDDLSKEIDKARIYYSTKASNVEKNGLRAELLSYEQEYYQMETEIRQLEKVIRSSELNAIK